MDGKATPNFEQASLLCGSVDRLPKDDEASLAKLSLAIDAGWSPFLHDFIARSNGGFSPGRFFGGDDQSMGMFERVHKDFPAMLESWRLLPRLAAAQERNRCRPGTAALASPWLHLAGRQKMWLMRAGPELLAPAKGVKGEGLDGWLMAMALALMPMRLAEKGTAAPGAGPGPEAVIDPFHGYFESAAWSSLSSEKPKLAHRLASLLCCVAGLHGSTAGWQATALARAADLGGRAEPADGWLGAVAAACVAEQLARDEPQRLAPMLACLGSKPLEAEASMFAKWTENRSLSEVLQRIASWPERGLAGKFKTPLDFGSLYDEQALKARRINISVDVSELPLFAMASVFKAPRCWALLESLYGSPFAMSALASHRSKLPSPFDIKERMERHMEAALAGAQGSAGMLRKSLDSEAERARLLLAKLPLPRALMADLLGVEEPQVPEPRPEAVSLEGRFNEEARGFFARACEKAHRKTRAGKPASLELPLAFDWMSMAMMLGARPSFFIGVAPPGSIARACSFMEQAFALGLHECLSGAERAFVEADELAWSTLPRAGAPTARRGPRL